MKKLSDVAHGAFWVLTEPTLDPAGNPTGYRVTTSTKSVGNFGDDVAPDVIDNLYSTPINAAVSQGYGVIIIDEIGKLQHQSPSFVEAVNAALASKATVMATLQQSEPWAHEFTGRPGIVTLELNEQNRDELAGALDACLTSQRMVDSLPADSRAGVERLAAKYAADGAITPFRKLFQNTIIYLAESRFESSSIGSYIVSGLTRRHTVIVTDGVWKCDCDLANGRGKFAGRPGECSHIQTIKISQKLV
jgi:hypothetical protein